MCCVCPGLPTLCETCPEKSLLQLFNALLISIDSIFTAVAVREEGGRGGGREEGGRREGGREGGRREGGREGEEEGGRKRRVGGKGRVKKGKGGE